MYAPDHPVGVIDRLVFDMDWSVIHCEFPDKR